MPRTLSEGIKINTVDTVHNFNNARKNTKSAAFIKPLITCNYIINNTGYMTKFHMNVQGNAFAN